MTHDSTYRDANSFGQRVHELLYAEPSRQPSPSNTMAAQIETIHDAFDELQGMTKRQLLAAWDGLLQRAHREQHIAAHLAGVAIHADGRTVGVRDAVRPVLALFDFHEGTGVDDRDSRDDLDDPDDLDDRDDLDDSGGSECDECYSVITSETWFSVEHTEYCSLHPDNVYEVGRTTEQE